MSVVRADGDLWATQPLTGAGDAAAQRVRALAGDDREAADGGTGSPLDLESDGGPRERPSRQWSRSQPVGRATRANGLTKTPGSTQERRHLAPATEDQEKDDPEDQQTETDR